MRRRNRRPRSAPTRCVLRAVDVLCARRLTRWWQARSCLRWSHCGGHAAGWRGKPGRLGVGCYCVGCTSRRQACRPTHAPGDRPDCCPMVSPTSPLSPVPCALTTLGTMPPSTSPTCACRAVLLKKFVMSGISLPGPGQEDPWEHVAPILTNVTRLKEGRALLLQPGRGLLHATVSQLQAPSELRRSGAAGAIKNCCMTAEVRTGPWPHGVVVVVVAAGSWHRGLGNGGIQP